MCLPAEGDIDDETLRRVAIYLHVDKIKKIDPRTFLLIDSRLIQKGKTADCSLFQSSQDNQ
jgi:hypothetical protein